MNNTITPPLPVVFLHGFSGDKDGLSQFANEYAGKRAVLVNLPGFGGSKAPALNIQRDFKKYTEVTWQEVRRQVPTGPIRLVGHSHGAMMGFAIACAHPDEIKQLDLLCPVAMPRLLPRLLAGTLGHLARLGMTSSLLRFMSWRPIVDLITWYLLRPEWDEVARDRIIQTRRNEARYYSSVMFEVMQKAVLFMKNMKHRHCLVPTTICYVTDENIAGAKDHEWYERHCATARISRTSGGHLGVMAEPERFARELLATAKESI